MIRYIVYQSKRKAAGNLCLLLLLLSLGQFVNAQTVTHPAPRPSAAQAAWHDMEFYLFAHFGPNTFTGLEWGKGNEHAEVFDPQSLDCGQWVHIAKLAGAKGIIITAKHHDGFCLWPSKYSTHTVRESGWRNGKGDVLKELSDACKKYGIKFGVYLSPWDRNHPAYGTPAYNDVFVNMLKEIFTNYGPIWELWWDGANGEGPNGKKQSYDFARYEKVVRSLSPTTIIFSDLGPDVRWCGNENGFAGSTNWNNLNTAGFTIGAGGPPADTLNRGNKYGRKYIPAEADVSIRPGWFYHAQEDTLLKHPEALFQIYLKSVGRGANLLLNVPPDTRGRISPQDSTALIEFRKLRDKNFSPVNRLSVKYTVWNGRSNRPAPTVRDRNNKTYVTLPATDKFRIDMKSATPTEVNCLNLEENLAEGQRCASFEIELKNADNKVLRTIKGTTIGHKRIVTFPSTTASVISFRILDAKAPVHIAEIIPYHIDETLIEK